MPVLTPRRPRPAGRPAARGVVLGLLLAAGALAPLAVPAAAGAASWRDVATLFRQTRYDEAASAAKALARQSGTSAEATFWTALLETEPDAALAAWRAALAREELAPALRARCAREIAGIEIARGRSAAARAALADLRRLSGRPLAGEPAIWAELAGQEMQPPAARERTERSRPRFALQLGAFNDEPRARALMTRWRRELAGLTLTVEPGPRRAPLYKVRLGNWPDRAAAAAEGDRLRRAHGLQTIVVEIVPRP